MIFTVFLALFLPCVGMSVVFVVYICLIWYAATYHSSHDNQEPVKPTKKSGLSAEQLDKLPKITGKELVLSNDDCAVCLESIESEQMVRLVPGCNHGFHLECADMWLSKHPFCPVCRTKLEFNPPDECKPC